MKARDKRNRISQLEGEVERLRKALELQAVRGTPLELSRREQLLLDAERVAHLGSWAWNLRSDEITWSDELYRIFGLDPLAVEPSSATFFSLVHPDDRERVQAANRRALESSEAEAVHFRVVGPGGEERDVHMESAFVDGTDGPRTLLVARR